MGQKDKNCMQDCTVGGPAVQNQDLEYSVVFFWLNDVKCFPEPKSQHLLLSLFHL